MQGKSDCPCLLTTLAMRKENEMKREDDKSESSDTLKLQKIFKIT